MNLKSIWLELLYLLKNVLGKVPLKVNGSITPIKPTEIKNEKIAKALDILKTNSEKTSEKVAIIALSEMDHTPTKEERTKRILDALVDDIIIQSSNKDEGKEVNLIHPLHAKYIVPIGAGYASEKTEEAMKRYAKIDYRYAEWYVYEALSAQWRPQYRVLISEAGTLVETKNGMAKIRARLHELWRQTLWTDIRTSDEFLKKHKISDAELEEFLFVLADDSVQFLPKTDRPWAN